MDAGALGRRRRRLFDFDTLPSNLELEDGNDLLLEDNFLLLLES